MFSISETLPWDIQKAQLKNLMILLPIGACIPLLIISDFGEEHSAEFFCSIVDKLGLNDLEKSRICRFIVICVNEDNVQSSLLNLMMATKEARLMVQKYTRLGLHDSEYEVVPSWVLIFRRVFNWQLNSSTSFSSKAYVLEQSLTTPNPPILVKWEPKAPKPCYSAYPSLDEMVEVSCSPVVSKRVRSSPKDFQKVVAIVSAENTFYFDAQFWSGREKSVLGN